MRDLDQLMPESKAALSDVLNDFYIVPNIIKVLDKSDRYGVLRYVVETDHGVRVIEIRNRHSDIRLLYGGRVLIRDADDNRYEIPDTQKLDRRSLSLLNGEI